MLRRFLVFCSMAVVCGLHSFVANGASFFDRYVGVLNYDGSKEQQVAKLDFVVGRTDGNLLELSGILTLHFGGFDSGEYVAYHFKKVKYNVLTGEMVFDQVDQEVTISEAQIKDGTFTGLIRSRSGGNIGSISLSQSNRASASGLLVESVGGEYVGQCQSETSRLFLQTYRSLNDTHRAGNPFGAYEIAGQLVQVDSNLCPPNSPLDPAPLCVVNQYRFGSYDFFNKRLELVGFPENLNCEVKNGDLDCGGCQLRKLEKTTTQSLTVPRSESIFPLEVSSNEIAQLNGEYSGYLHHEFLNVYQSASLNIITFQDQMAEHSLRISAVSKLFFGNFQSKEFLTYRFDERAFPFPGPQAHIILSQPEADVDAILKITSWGEGNVRGVWYSQLFGRVGTFVLYKNGAPKLPANMNVMPALSGLYDRQDAQIKIDARLGSSPFNTENPFFPLQITGYLFHKGGFLPRINLNGGSYDFYTGRIGLLIEEDIGWVSTGARKNNHLELYLPARKFGTVFQVPNALPFAPVK